MTAGTGKRGIVLIHGSGSRGICVWLKELPWLAAAGYHVLAYDQGCVGGSSCPQPTDPLLEARIVTAHLKRLGAERVTVVAASAGGPYALHLAADPDSGITAAVALSPAGLDKPLAGVDQTADAAAARLQVPLVMAASPDDSSVDSATLQRLKGAGGSKMTIDALPAGAGNAQEILYAPGSSAPSDFRKRLLAFLKRRSGS